MGQRSEFLRLHEVSNTLPALRCLALLLVPKDTLVGGDEQRRGLGYIFAALASALASVVGRQPVEKIKLSQRGYTYI